MAVENPQKPQQGDWISARRVINGDGSDETRDEGVVVGLPRKGNGDITISSLPTILTFPFKGMWMTQPLFLKTTCLPGSKASNTISTGNSINTSS